MSATTPSQTPTPVADLSYEQARDELVSLVSRIESGQVPLEEAMLLWERGEALAKHCQDKLDAAQASLERTDASAAGAPDPSAAAPSGQGQDVADVELDADDDHGDDDYDDEDDDEVTPAG